MLLVVFMLHVKRNGRGFCCFPSDCMLVGLPLPAEEEPRGDARLRRNFEKMFSRDILVLNLFLILESQGVRATLAVVLLVSWLRSSARTFFWPDPTW